MLTKNQIFTPPPPPVPRQQVHTSEKSAPSALIACRYGMSVHLIHLPLPETVF